MAKDSTKDQVKGKAHEVKGKIQEKVGRVTNNPKLESEGQDEAGDTTGTPDGGQAAASESWERS